jgi:hypothetical protein
VTLARGGGGVGAHLLHIKGLRKPSIPKGVKPQTCYTESVLRASMNSSVHCSTGGGGGWQSSVGIATDYGLDDRAVRVRVPVGPRLVLLELVETSCGAHPASYPLGTASSFPGRDADHPQTSAK